MIVSNFLKNSRAKSGASRTLSYTVALCFPGKPPPDYPPAELPVCFPHQVPEEIHLQHNEGEDEKEMHASDEVSVDPNNPQGAGPFTQGVNPAVDGVNEEGQTSEGATVS